MPKQSRRTTLPRRPALAATDIEPSEYRVALFEADLEAIIVSPQGPFLRLSVSSFCPDYPSADLYKSIGDRFHQLNDSCWFLLCLFSLQLLNQASHFATGRVITWRCHSARNAVLVGLLQSYWNIVDPGFLLLVLSLYDLPFSQERLAEGVRRIVKGECDDSMRAVTTGEADRVRAAALGALAPDAMPTSLRAFVPHGDRYRWPIDAGLVDILRAAAIDGLSAVT